MKITQLIPVEHICIGWPGNFAGGSKNKSALLRDAVRFLGQKNGLKENQVSTLLERVYEREKTKTTGIGQGVAIPHASSELFEKPTGAFFLIPEGIGFEAIDFQPVYLVFLAFFPLKKYENHIQVLGNLVELTSMAGATEKLRAQDSPENLWQLLDQMESSLITC